MEFQLTPVQYPRQWNRQSRSPLKTFAKRGEGLYFSADNRFIFAHAGRKWVIQFGINLVGPMRDAVQNSGVMQVLFKTRSEAIEALTAVLEDEGVTCL